MSPADDRIHPASVATLRQLVKLHGADRLIRTIQDIVRTQARQPGADVATARAP